MTFFGMVYADVSISSDTFPSSVYLSIYHIEGASLNDVKLSLSFLDHFQSLRATLSS